MITDSGRVPFPLPYACHNLKPAVSGWQMTTHQYPTISAPFETQSQYGYTTFDYENYPGTYASPEKPPHGYGYGIGNYPQTHPSTENYSTTHSYNLHSHSPSTHKVHGNPHGSIDHLHGQNGGHQNGYGGHQIQHGGHQAYGHPGSWPSGDHKINGYGHGHQNNGTVYYAYKGVDD